MSTILPGRRIPVQVWANPEEIEAQALAQLTNVSALPWAFHHVAAMADCHFGIGATVGSVIAMKDAVCPAAVGVDLSCGMAAVKTSLRAEDLPESLRGLRNSFERSVPVGFHSHKDPLALILDTEGQYGKLWNRFPSLTTEVQHLMPRAQQQMGTLGGGNHFIELCLDTGGAVWLMLHSGSRNIGKELAEIHIERARKLAHNQDLPDRDLAVFIAGTPQMAAYRNDLYWAQDYAYLNRLTMLTLLQKDLRYAFKGKKLSFEEPILCHHNYVAEETHFGEEVFVTRKGAISAEKGRLGIIPGSMGTQSFIVRGLGHPDSFNSASHGAGRKMSRGQARRTFTAEDLAEQTQGVECRTDIGVVDEIPAAYKDISQVMHQQRDLVEIVAEMKQVLCIKG